MVNIWKQSSLFKSLKVVLITVIKKREDIARQNSPKIKKLKTKIYIIYFYMMILLLLSKLSSKYNQLDYMQENQQLA